MSRIYGVCHHSLYDAGPTDSADFAELFRDLYAALDEGKVSYLQGTLQVIVDTGIVEEVGEQHEALSIQGTFRDQ